MAAIHTSNNTLLQAATDPIFTGIQHDETLSGLGTLESPLGCIKDDFTGVSTDSTISGDGLNSPLGVVGINSFTGVITDNNLTGNGYDSALGLNSSISADEFKAGNTTVTDNSITMSDTYGDTTVNPTKIRTWDAMAGNVQPVIPNFPVSASFVVGGVDDSEVSAMTFQVVRPAQNITGNTVIIKNELGSSGQFAMIPYTQTAGMLAYNSGNITVETMPPEPTCSAYYMTSGFPSVNFVTPNGLRNLLVTTPYAYNGPSNYSAKIDGDQFIMGSGTYANFAKAQKENGTISWVIAGSGYWEF